MGLFDFIGSAKSTLFGDDVDTKTSTGPTSGTKTTQDSGQTSYGTSNTSGFNVTNNNQTSVNHGTTINSGSTNTSTNSGRTDAVTQQAYTDTSTTGPSSSTTNTSGRVDTSQVMLSETATNHLIRGMLESNSGLAAVSSGQKAAGGYNSTATSLLTNDLLSRVAGEVAVRGAKTVNTIGAQSSTTNNSGSTTTNQFGQKTTNQTIGDSKVTDVIGGSTSNTYNLGEMTGVNINNQNLTTNQNQTTGPRTVVENASTAATSSKTKKDEKGVLDWIICTELYNQGRMPWRIYIPGARKFLTYDEQIKRGYYIWAVPATKHLRKHPNSLFSKFLEIIFNARASYFAGDHSVINTVASGLVHGFCWGLSRTIGARYVYDRSDIYSSEV